MTVNPSTRKPNAINENSKIRILENCGYSVPLGPVKFPTLKKATLVRQLEVSYHFITLGNHLYKSTL